MPKSLTAVGWVLIHATPHNKDTNCANYLHCDLTHQIPIGSHQHVTGAMSGGKPFHGTVADICMYASASCGAGAQSTQQVASDLEHQQMHQVQQRLTLLQSVSPATLSLATCCTTRSVATSWASSIIPSFAYNVLELGSTKHSMMAWVCLQQPQPYNNTSMMDINPTAVPGLLLP